LVVPAGSAALPPFGIANLGFAARAVALDGGLIAFAVPESQQGSTDLNGDGDFDDEVLHVFETATGTTRNLGLASDALRLDEGLLIFNVREVGQGATDLNGDGDTDDAVTHVYDVASGTTTNLRLVGEAWSREGRLFAFAVDEFRQGETDLNGDGDPTDLVVHVYDAATGTTTNLGFAQGSFESRLDGGLLVFAVDEFGQGETDLNGDGDAGDLVVHLHDAATRATTNLMLSGFDLSFDEGLLAFAVDEFRQGGTDLNGDGDAGDLVVHVYDVATATTASLGLAVGHNGLWLDEGLLVFTVSEELQGGTDLNGDGDGFDDVVYFYESATGTSTNLKLAGGPFSFDDGLLAFGVDEAFQGQTDLNGDGDSRDSVFHLFDAATDTITNLSLSGFELVQDERQLAFTVNEFTQGTDLNDDGDTDDGVFHFHDAATGLTTNLRLASTAGALDVSLDEGILAFAVDERDQGAELNGDGDGFDSVFHLYEAATGTTTNLGLAGPPPGSGFGPPVLDSGLLAFTVFEESQGETDLNGDSDVGAAVLHLLSPGEGAIDSDSDGLADEEEATIGTDPLDPDSDDDDIVDGSDPSTITIVLAALSDNVFKAGSGDFRDELTRLLAMAEAKLANGSEGKAISRLNNVRRRLDGCNGGTAEAPGHNDWIIDCAAQHRVRGVLDLVIANLGT
jgi:hypothetical protein